MSFIFGGNTEMSYEDLQRKRRIADAMIGQNSNAPRNVGEGLAAIGRALAARAIDKRVSAREKELQSDADKMWQAAMGGFDTGGMYGGSAAYSGASSGGYGAGQPYTPDATDSAEMGGGGYALGDSVASPEMVASPKGDLAMGADLNWLTYANQGAIRSQPISPELENALSFLPDLGVSMEVFSGGQDASGPHRTGSTRHNHGGAADVFFSKDGRRLDWNNPSDQPIFAEIVKRAKANGVTGFGAGEGYMQPGSMHIGFGNPAVWGAGGKGANAAPWLQAAYGGVPSSGGVSPGGGYSGPSVAAIARVMSNPMIRNDPAKMAIANMLMQRSMQASDPMYQLKLRQAQLDYEQDASGMGGAKGAFGNLDAQARAAGLTPGTPEYQSFMMNGGGAPATFRALDMQAQAAGFKPGTPEYSQFMATRGAGLQAGAKTTATNEANIATGGEAERVKAAGAAQGKQDVEQRSELAEMERNMPSLLVVVKQLGELADTATYTMAGRARDEFNKQLGREPSDGAVARAKYIAMVDNQVLPLLRQTFGAQFTAQEGESLKATLGDPDKTPAEKKAVLEAFIAQKKRDIIARGGTVPGETKAPPADGAAPDFGGMNAAQIQEYMKANPASEWSPEQRAAVIARLKELKGQE